MTFNQKQKPGVLIVYPPLTKMERYSSAIGESGGQQIPLGIYYLAAYIRQHGFQTEVIDAETMDLSIQDVLAKIRLKHHRIIGISITTVAFHRALELAESIKTLDPDAVIVAGGPHVSSQPAHAMQFDAIDFAVRNEGEETFLELLKNIDAKPHYKSIKGLIFRENGQVVVNEMRPYIADIDALPFPAYDLIPDLKRYTPPPSNYQKSPVANIITSRGCPNQCTFCDNNTFGCKIRMRSAQSVVDEIELLMHDYGVKEIAFVDDTFTISNKRLSEIFRLTRERGLKFPWTCMARINTVNEKILGEMKENGCWHISFGIESGNEDILRLIRKNISLADTEKIIDQCYRLGIRTKGFFIIGHPKETPETIDQTIELGLRLKLDDIVVTINTPMPGSKQYEQAEIYGRIDTTQWTKFNYWNPVFVPHGLTADYIKQRHREFYRRFYLRIRILWRYFTSLFSLTGIQRAFKLLKASKFLIQK
jgi:anaerobic magnesium-protoporphyrin IX monomethyl ester cyclase